MLAVSFRVLIINLFHSQTMWFVDQRVNDASLSANCRSIPPHFLLLLATSTSSNERQHGAKRKQTRTRVLASQ